MTCGAFGCLLPPSTAPTLGASLHRGGLSGRLAARRAAESGGSVCVDDRSTGDEAARDSSSSWWGVMEEFTGEATHMLNHAELL